MEWSSFGILFHKNTKSEPSHQPRMSISSSSYQWQNPLRLAQHQLLFPSSSSSTSSLPTMTLRTNNNSSSGDSSLSSLNLRSTRNSAVAGYTAGFVGVVLGHPLDSLKVWAQTNSSGKNKHFGGAAAPVAPSASSGGSSSSISSSYQAAAGTTGLQRSVPRTTGTASMSTLARSAAICIAPATSVKTSSLSSSSVFHPSQVLRRVRALYSGASGPLVTVGIVQSINFSTYDAMRRYLHHREFPNAPHGDYLHHDSLVNVGIAGFVAGTGLACITSPLIMVKTQQQITGNGFRQAFRETLYRPNGKLNLGGCFVGIYPHLLSETVGRALYYCVYEACKRQTSAYKAEQGLSPVVSLTERMGAAALAGICCWTAIFPLDALRNRLYSQAGRMATASTSTAAPLLSTWEMAQCMYRERALYRGFSLTVLRAGPVAAAVLPVYDLVLEYLSSTY